jgi:stage II sporulation protein P
MARRWISIVLIAAAVVLGGIYWRAWLPAAANFALRGHARFSMQRMGILLLKNTDPVLRNVALYLTPEAKEAIDEPFLFFLPQKEPAPSQEAPSNIKPTNLSALSGIYTQYDGTAVANATAYDVSADLQKGVKMPSFTEGRPAILIYHTHTTECYRNDEGVTNTKDEQKNVVAVGEALKKEFEAAGYQVIHIKEIFNSDFSNAYSTARARISEVLEQNPTVEVVLDVHRDSISGNGVQYYPVTEVDGREAAQIMFVCGTDSKGLSHPDWRKNFTYALAVSRKMGVLYGELSRPVNLREDRFNTHFTDYTLLMEVGSEANTLEQAIYGAQLSARAMIALWQDKSP